jgi:hypothetical protein
MSTSRARPAPFCRERAPVCDRGVPVPGYSGTPLARKLGLKPGLRVLLLGAPPEYAAWLGDLPAGVAFTARAARTVEAAHLFVTDRAALHKRLGALRGSLAPDGWVWVSWPKKSSKVPTDVTEDVIRAVALPLGFVDIKVCAVSDVWSGLKLVIRRSERPAKR